MAAIIENDAVGCYDRLMSPLFLLAMRRLGVPETMTKSLGLTWSHTRHTIKTQYGVSTITYTNEPSTPLVGPSQGSSTAHTGGGGVEAEGTAGTGSRTAADGPLVRADSCIASPVEADTRRRPAASTSRQNSCRKSIPMMGKDTAARRKRQVKLRPENSTVTSLSPQHGMMSPLGPVRRGPDGGDGDW